MCCTYCKYHRVSLLWSRKTVAFWIKHKQVSFLTRCVSDPRKPLVRPEPNRGFKVGRTPAWIWSLEVQGVSSVRFSVLRQLKINHLWETAGFWGLLTHLWGKSSYLKGVRRTAANPFLIGSCDCEMWPRDGRLPIISLHFHVRHVVC